MSTPSSPRAAAGASVEPGVPEDWDDPLASAFRRWGFLVAHTDPLGRIPPLLHADLADARRTGGEDRIRHFEGAYCGTLAAEFMHMLERERSAWMARRMESPPEPVDHDFVFDRLLHTETFERFLHSRYVGSKRYSLEGMASLVPLLDSILERAAHAGAAIVLIAMSHRGRLNVMANIVGTAAEDVFAGMEDVDPRSVLGGGDVKYHQGATGDYECRDGSRLHVHLVSNPSHLEAVGPVAMGRARARQLRIGDEGRVKVLLVLLHGDAAFAGQGVAAETLNLASLDGYEVGGTVHVLVNNLIGFTTQPAALHSSRTSSDLAHRLSIPILHVDAEDPDAVMRAGAIATDFRYRFASDVLVDLVGYRRYGHSEIEDPTTTQPALYDRIHDLPMLHEAYAREKRIESSRVETMRQAILDELSRAQDAGRKRTHNPVLRRLPDYWSSYHGGYDVPADGRRTRVDPATIDRLAEVLTRVPDGFSLHPKVAKLFETRRRMLAGEQPVDWGTAELLAMGTLLEAGYPVRMSGQDVRRGTFNQRHAVVFDTKTEEEWIPLAHLQSAPGRFWIHDSPLSEAAPLGFEYGFSRDMPDALVCWEAQFGDFANGGQVIIDQFIAAGEDKWGLLSGLVLLLPHGYEGQGPEHSSARIERFLQLAAEHNLQICLPSTSAQYFHLLRRQVFQSWRKPLVVFTPKGLLRSKSAACPIDCFTDEDFHPVLGDRDVENARRVLVCSGRIAHDLFAERERRGISDVAIVRLAELYPFPEDELHEELRRHSRSAHVVWIQEEPGNQGALSFVRPRLQVLLGDRHLSTVKRSDSASPATGSPGAHRLEEKALMDMAFARL